MNFGVRTAPLLDDIGISDFMEWIDTEFKALPEVIFGTSDIAAVFWAESNLKLLHDFHCADLVKFREKLSHFPDASSTKLNSKLLKLNSQENSGSLAARKLSRTLLVPNLTRLTSRKHYCFLAMHENFFFSFFLDFFL
jgi:hypothetical protein